MKHVSKPALLHTAHEDLLNRTLSKLSGEFARLIYLASTRDYNSGIYHHEGLSSRFGAEEAAAALWTAHREVFWRLASLSLEEIVEQLEVYTEGVRRQGGDLLRAWRELEPYRVAIPMDVDPVMIQLLLSNIKLGLEVLRIRQKKSSARSSGAWQLPSPAQ